jgi:hypothetical protein
LKMRRIGFLETSVKNHHYKLCNTSEEGSPQIHFHSQVNSST